MHPIVAIVGPTASGKSDLAVSLAERFGGEIVNYDSVQIFRHLDIGSAKPSPEERRRVPHHMIDVRDPDQLFTAGDYQREARAVLADLRDRGRLPILVGGTGLYLRALIEGLFSGPVRSSGCRERLEKIAEAKGREHLHRMLARFDPVAAARIGVRDKPKVIRALEVRLETGKALTDHLASEPRQPLEGFDVHMMGLNPEREEAFRRIDARVVQMFEKGLVEEVQELLARGIPRDAKPLGAIGYRHILQISERPEDWDSTIRLIQRDTRRYAKRQMTWFRKLPNVTWFDGTGDMEHTQEEVHRQLIHLFPGTAS